MKKSRIICMLLALSMLVSVTAFASRPDEPDGYCPNCGGTAEAVGTKAVTFVSARDSVCTSNPQYTDKSIVANVRISFECYGKGNCGQSYTQAIKMPYGTKCNYTNTIEYSDEAYEFAFTGHLDEFF